MSRETGIHQGHAQPRPKLVLIHYVSEKKHEIYVFAGEIPIAHEDHLDHGEHSCWATIASDIAIGLGIEMDERRVSEADYLPVAQQQDLLDFSATTKWENKGGYGTPAGGPE